MENHHRVNDLALVVQNQFEKNPFITVVDKNTFAWFKNSKFGVNNMLSVKIQVKDGDGKPYERKLPRGMKFKTELVYEDNSPAPLQPLCPLQDSQKKNPTAIFHKMYGEPKVSRVNDPVSFWFRIEEVSFHHSGHKGFRLNVSLTNMKKSFRIHQSPMNEVLVVLSKPKLFKNIAITMSSNTNAKRKRDDDHSDDKDNKIDVFRGVTPGNFSVVPPHPVKVEEENVSTPQNRESEVAVIPLGAVVDSYRCLGSCFCCNVNIDIESFLIQTQHEDTCIFANQVLPILTLMGVNSDLSTKNIQTPIVCDKVISNSDLFLSPSFEDSLSTIGSNTSAEKNLLEDERPISDDTQEKGRSKPAGVTHEPPNSNYKPSVNNSSTSSSTLLNTNSSEIALQKRAETMCSEKIAMDLFMRDASKSIKNKSEISDGFYTSPSTNFHKLNHPVDDFSMTPIQSFITNDATTKQYTPTIFEDPEPHISSVCSKIKLETPPSTSKTSDTTSTPLKDDFCLSPIPYHSTDDAKGTTSIDVKDELAVSPIPYRPNHVVDPARDFQTELFYFSSEEEEEDMVEFHRL